ncbi:helix-turn-helix transcriptional regulator [Nonomuraea sp. NPDC049709]|uniref:helix-turn-helix domain-containing protein n=1 Tax=Nonomuraea sp. NPDC049709 TaxID=3154736 RepID=UPI003436C772
MGQIEHRAEVREFLGSRRARITPEQAGLPAYGGNRRVKGLRREEVAMLAGVSIDYYVRMERGNLSGASDSVLDALARALYSPVLADPRRPANTTRFVYLDPAAREFFVDWDRVANDAAAMLRLEAGRNPHDRALIELVGELSTQSEVFRQRWASHDVQFHRSGRKRLRHPVVGQLDLDFESMELPSEPGLTLNVYTATPGSPTADGLKMLASWAATQDLAEAQDQT